MKKIIMTAAAALLATAAAQADYTAFYVNTNEGKEIEFRFDMGPVATFEENNLVITDDAGDKVMYDMKDVSSITFKTISGVGEIKEGRVSVTVGKFALVAEGLEEGETVAIYTLSGSRVAEGRADSEGRVEIAVSELEKGVYIVNAPGHSFKFVK